MTDTLTNYAAAIDEGTDALDRGDMPTAREARDNVARGMVLQNILARIATLPDE